MDYDYCSITKAALYYLPCKHLYAVFSVILTKQCLAVDCISCLQRKYKSHLCANSMATTLIIRQCFFIYDFAVLSISSVGCRVI